MNDSTFERRRAPRLDIPGGDTLQFAVSLPAQVLEINLSGVLLASKTEMAVGERGELRMLMGNRSLNVAIEARAVSEETHINGGPRYRIGAAFMDVTTEQRQRLQELLGMGRH
jgi:hypothetical protein